MLQSASAANTWISVANALFLVSYAVHDILWLRILSLLGSIVLIKYYLLLQPTQPIAMIWTILFISLNAFWIVRLIVARRPVRLSPNEERLKALSFPMLGRREARQLFSMGRWDDVVAGVSLVERDKVQGRLSVILTGTVDVTYRGRIIGELTEGQFVGEIDRCAAALNLDAIVRARSIVMCWPEEVLGALLTRNPGVALALERSLDLELRNFLSKALPNF
jgi:hypothetical protein